MAIEIVSKLLPQKLKHRVGLLIGILGFGTVIINLFILFLYLNFFIRNNVYHLIDSNFKINEQHLLESILYEDIYSIFETLKLIKENAPFIKNIYLFDKNKSYIADAQAKRDLKELPQINDSSANRIKILKIKDEALGYLFFSIDKQVIKSNIIKNLIKLAIINTFIIIIGVLIGLYLTKILVKPMNEFIKQINNLNYDKLPFKTSVPFYASIEIKKLSKTLNEMSERLNETLNKLYEEERKVRRNEKLASVGTMAAGIAHELKNPIMTIKLIVYQLSKCAVDNKACKEDLKIIKNETDRLVNRINEFLEYTKPVKIEKSKIDIKDIKKELSFFTSRLQNKITLKIFTNTDVLYTDKEKLLQILLNLINNALEAKATKLKIKISSSQNDIIIDVIDNGIGIDKDKKDKIFMPFFTTKATGTGLGLAMCDMIASAMDGEIILKKSSKFGTIFRIILRGAKIE